MYQVVELVEQPLARHRPSEPGAERASGHERRGRRHGRERAVHILKAEER
jgi:hypothetical protein